MCGHIIPECIAIAQCDCRKSNTGVVVDLHVHRDRPAQVVLNAGGHLEQENHHPSQKQQKPDKPATQIFGRLSILLFDQKRTPILKSLSLNFFYIQKRLLLNLISILLI